MIVQNSKEYSCDYSHVAVNSDYKYLLGNDVQKCQYKQGDRQMRNNKVVYEIRSNAWEYERIVHVADTKGARSLI